MSTMYQKTELILKSLNVLGGTFNNYVDQILPNFDPHPPQLDILDTIYPLSRDTVDFLLTPHPPYPVHIVIECPLV